jgi:DNA-binding IclR family transcriptional regulator
MALAAVGGRPGLNNREVSEIIGLSDQSQISRMMKRLCEQGLIENTLAHTKRQARAWRLTADGEAAIDGRRRGRDLVDARRKVGKGGNLVPIASDRRGKTRIAAAGAEVPNTSFRMTALTHDVLNAVATLSKGESNPTNREIANLAGVKDDGQISKLLARLQGHGLLKNTSDQPATGNAWRLTERGMQLLAASGPSREGAGR